jgi:hypothetical protein
MICLGEFLLYNCIYPIHYFIVFIFKDLLPNVEDVHFQSHVPKGELYQPVPTINKCIAVAKKGLL